jgi:hypothetical protein
MWRWRIRSMLPMQGFTIGAVLAGLRASAIWVILAMPFQRPPELPRPTPTDTREPSESRTQPATQDPEPTSRPSKGPSEDRTTPPRSRSYVADWSSGSAGWSGQGWSAVGGMLVNDGQSYSNVASVLAPVDLSGISNFVVKADIQLVRYTDEGALSGLASFGLVVRSDGADEGGYGAGHGVSSGIYLCVPDQSGQHVGMLWTSEDPSPSVIASAPYRPGGDWHRYRVEVRGNQ